MTIFITIIGIFASLLLFVIIKRTQGLKSLRYQLSSFEEKYKEIIDVDKPLAIKNEEFKSINLIIDALKTDFEKQKEQLNQDYLSKRSIYENLISRFPLLKKLRRYFVWTV